jgi:hypothetical protein
MPIPVRAWIDRRSVLINLIECTIVCLSPYGCEVSMRWPGSAADIPGAPQFGMVYTHNRRIEGRAVAMRDTSAPARGHDGVCSGQLMMRGGPSPRVLADMSSPVFPVRYQG